MKNSTYHSTLLAEIEGVSLGDKRLDRRCKVLLERLDYHNKRGIHASQKNWTEAVGAYRFLNNQRIDCMHILEPHRQQSMKRAATQKQLKVIQDSSELDFSNLKTMAGAGPIGSLSRQGFFMHPQLLLGEDSTPLGISHIHYYARKDEEHGKAEEKKSKPIEEKESFRWLEGYRHACDIQQQLPSAEVFSVADREADIYEIFLEPFECEKQAGCCANYVIRASENRALAKTHEGKRLFDYRRDGEASGLIEFDIDAARQSYKVKGNRRIRERSARKVVQEVRYQKVTLRPPHRKHTKLAPVTLWVVSASEIKVPDDQDPIEWQLLTNKPITSFEDAREIVKIYTERWAVEIFFKTLKSGCKIEELELKKAASAQRAITLLSIVAWKILYLTHVARNSPNLACGRFIESDEWRATLMITQGVKQAQSEPTIAEYIEIVAKLGGYRARKHDPPPGSEVIWRGLQKVEAYAEAWRSFQRLE